MSKKLYELTEEHKAQLEPWAKKWIANALSTKPMDEEDKQICRENVIKMYKAAGLEPPKNIVFVPSPFVLRFAGGLASAILNTNNDIYIAPIDAVVRATYRVTYDDTYIATDDATYRATNDATFNATDDATYRATSDATNNATNAAVVRATSDATYRATNAAVVRATNNATYRATSAAVVRATYRATSYEAIDATNDAIYIVTNANDNNSKPNTNVKEKFKYWYVVDNCLKDLDKHFKLDGKGIKEANAMYNSWQGGNQWSGQLAFITFFRYVVQLDKINSNVNFDNWDAYEKLGVHGGPRIVHKDFCMISDRPELLLLDDQNRPHCTTGPFCRWRDGSELYAWHGVHVPAWIIKFPQLITVEDINKESNIEVRRVMMQLMGEEQYLLQSNFEVLDTDTDQFGRERRLLRSSTKDDEAIVRVEVMNSTIEMDGTYKKYYLPVDPELRPILKDPEDITEELTREEMIAAGWLGKPQKMTCHNAVASTFGEYGKNYGKPGQTRQGDVFIKMKTGKNKDLPFRES